MFTLVVFTLVTGTASNGSFVRAVSTEDYGGGFQVRAGTVGAAGSKTWRRRCASARSRCRDFTAVGSQSVLAVEARQVDAGAFETYLVRGLDDAVPRAHDVRPRQLGAGYDTEQEVWDAVRTTPVSRSSTARSSLAATTGISACRRTSSSRASTTRKGVRPDPSRGPRQADRQRGRG